MDLTKVLNLMERISSNYEVRLLDMTYGACIRGCGRSARGGSICPFCATEELGEIIGDDLANEYHEACKNVRRVAQAIHAKLELDA